MTTEALLDLLNAGRILEPGTPESMGMNDISVRAREICALINQESSDVPRIGELFSELIGEPVPEGFRLFPPFTSDFGRNIHLGENVFINVMEADLSPDSTRLEYHKKYADLQIDLTGG